MAFDFKRFYSTFVKLIKVIAN